MSLAKGRYGVEYNPRQFEREPSGVGWLVAVVAVIALASLTWTVVKRVRGDGRDAPAAEGRAAEAAADGAAAPAPSRAEGDGAGAAPAAPLPAAFAEYPAKLRNLLMRLAEAERIKDVEMAATTIETIRALPGSPAADRDDALARRLGALNVRRLFVMKNAQWVKSVVVRRGVSAARIAAEHGSTLASLTKLNGGSLSGVVAGRKVSVMNHPRFSLVIRRRARAADLSLNGKFFKRYDFEGGVVSGKTSFKTPAEWRGFWSHTLGVSFSPADRAELETLLPPGAPVMISEM